MLYYAHQGDFVVSEMFRERVEVYAIQRGTAWQAETWAFGALVGVYSRTHDPIGIKHCIQQLQHLSQEVPSLERVIGLAQGSYLLLRGADEEAIQWLTRDEVPLAHAGWTRSRGALALAYNRLGQPARAKAVCLGVERELAPADYEFPAMNLTFQLEHAVADAALGDHAAAVERLERMIERHGPAKGPLTMSAIHEARMRVAAIMRDRTALEYHCELMEEWQNQTRIRSLIAHGERVAKLARATAGCAVPEPAAAPSDVELAQPLTVVHRIRHGGELTLSGSAEWILDQLVRFAEVRAGHVYRWQAERLTCVASRGELPDPTVFEMWLMQRLWNDEDEATVRIEVGTPFKDSDLFIVNDRGYRLLRLVTSPSTGSTLAGVLVLSEETSPIEIPSPVLRVIAERLHASDTVSA
jgi:hypothetical protein